MSHTSKESAMKELTRTMSKMTRRAAKITYFERDSEWHTKVELGYEHAGMSTHFEFERNGYEVTFV